MRLQCAAFALLTVLLFPSSSNIVGRDRSAAIHEAMVLGSDGRMTIEEYAAAHVADGGDVGAEIQRLKSEFSGVGLLDCGGLSSTAQLTGANDVITFAGPTQFGENCEDYRNRKDRCSFKPVFLDHPAVMVDYRSIQSQCEKGNSRMDWAVARLKRPVKGARYFKVPKEDVRWRRRTEILQISAYHDKNFRNGDRRPTLQRCSIRVANFLTNPDLHDCDTDEGSSGSAQVDPDPDREPSGSGAGSHTIFAVNVREGNGQETAPGTPEALLKDYDFDAVMGRSNASVPVAGAFRQAILKAIRK